MQVASLVVGSGVDKLDLIAWADAMGYELSMSGDTGQLAFKSGGNTALTLPANELIDQITAFQVQHSGAALYFDFETGFVAGYKHLALAFVDTSSLPHAAAGSGLIRFLDLCDGVDKIRGIFDATTLSIIDTNLMFNDPKILAGIDALLSAVKSVGGTIVDSMTALKSDSLLSESSNSWSVNVKFMGNDEVMRLHAEEKMDGSVDWTFVQSDKKGGNYLALSMLDSGTFQSYNDREKAYKYYDNNFAHVSDMEGHLALYFHEWCGANRDGTFASKTAEIRYDRLKTLQNWLLFMDKVPSPVLHP